MRERIDYLKMTKHGKSRARERVGIPARAVQRAARCAFERGQPVWATDRAYTVSVLHGAHVWHFSLNEGDIPVLTTVFPTTFYDWGNEGALRAIDLEH
jgi:hypothetical protein